MLMDLVCKACGELMEDAVKNNMRIRVLTTDTTLVRGCVREGIWRALLKFLYVQTLVT